MIGCEKDSLAIVGLEDGERGFEPRTVAEAVRGKKTDSFFEPSGDLALTPRC